MLTKLYPIGEVASSGQRIQTAIELPIEAKKIEGILLVCDRPEQLYHRGTIEISVSGQEVFPEGYHAQLLMTGANTSPNLRWFNLDVPVGNRDVKIKFEDVDNGAVPHQTYEPTIYFKLGE